MKHSNPTSAHLASSLVAALGLAACGGMEPGNAQSFGATEDAVSTGYLYIPQIKGDSVQRYNAATGAFVDEIVAHKSGGLSKPLGVVIGPKDGDLYVTSGVFGGPGQLKGVLRYNINSGAFIDQFAGGNPLNSPRTMLFGPDGNLYVADGVDPQIGWIDRYDASTGAFIDQFVAPGSGGLINPVGMVFGPDGNLYVASARNSNVLRFDGHTGAFIDEFVPAGTGGLDHALGVVFDKNGNLYVTSGGYDANATIVAFHGVLRFQGPGGRSPGALIDTFVASGSGGLLIPQTLLFGPDVTGDRHQDIYIPNARWNGSFGTVNNTASVKVYDGVTGAFVMDFIPAGGRLQDTGYMVFTQTNAMTLAFGG